MTYQLSTTPVFEKWFKNLNDRSVHNKVLARLARMENGHFGDFKTLETNLYELRFFFGGGLRIYYTIRNGQIVLLLTGGDKSSQERDIAKARQLLAEGEEQ